MDREASLELLNATHEFPCAFTLKVIGESSDDFIERCLAAVKSTNLVAGQIPVSSRSTPKGRHMSVTMTPELASAEDVLIVYEALRTVEGVVMTM